LIIVIAFPAFNLHCLFFKFLFIDIKLTIAAISFCICQQQLQNYYYYNWSSDIRLKIRYICNSSLMHRQFDGAGSKQNKSKSVKLVVGTGCVCDAERDRRDALRIRRIRGGRRVMHIFELFNIARISLCDKRSVIQECKLRCNIERSGAFIKRRKSFIRDISVLSAIAMIKGEERIYIGQSTPVVVT